MQNDVHTDWLVFYKYSENSVEQKKNPHLSMRVLVREGGFAFLRKSHGGCGTPLACR